MALVNQPAILSGAFAAEGDKNTIPANNDGLSGLASIAKGFPPITQVPLAQGGQPPQRQDFNGIFNLFSQFLLYAQNGGVYAYNNTLDYQPPCIISYDGEFYSCLQENGPSTSAGVQAPTIATYWEKLVPDVAVMTGASASQAGTAGLVPTPAQNQQGYFLTGAGIWQPVATTQQAEAGTDDTAPMTALKVKQAITAQVQGIPIGDVVYRPFLMDGYVKANGATVNREDYPTLVDYATTNNLWYDSSGENYTFSGTTAESSTTITGISSEDIAKLKQDYVITGTGIPVGTTITAIDTDSITISQAATAAGTVTISFGNIKNFPWMYGVGDGSTTMVLPDYRGRFIQGGDSNAIIAAGLPNITGTFMKQYYAAYGGQATGAFKGVKQSAAGASDNSAGYGFEFDASWSNPIYGSADTVQPPTIQLLPQIKY